MDTRPGTRARRSYEDFEPSSELVQEQGSDTLLVDLAGFTKEQVRVQIDDSGNLRISGERPLGDNKWTRFCKNFLVSSKCNTREIRATFEDEILFVNMPKFMDQSSNKDQNHHLVDEPILHEATLPPPLIQEPKKMPAELTAPTEAPLNHLEPSKSTLEAQVDHQLEYSSKQPNFEGEKMKDGSIKNRKNMTRGRAGFLPEDFKNRSAGSMVVVVVLVVVAIWFSVKYTSTYPLEGH